MHVGMCCTWYLLQHPYSKQAQPQQPQLQQPQRQQAQEPQLQPHKQPQQPWPLASHSTAIATAKATATGYIVNSAKNRSTANFEPIMRAKATTAATAATAKATTTTQRDEVK